VGDKIKMRLSRFWRDDCLLKRTFAANFGIFSITWGELRTIPTLAPYASAVRFERLNF
jgi:hypothetical protein